MCIVFIRYERLKAPICLQLAPIDRNPAFYIYKQLLSSSTVGRLFEAWYPKMVYARRQASQIAIWWFVKTGDYGRFELAAGDCELDSQWTVWVVFLIWEVDGRTV